MPIRDRIRNTIINPRLRAATTEELRFLKSSLRKPKPLGSDEERLLRQDFDRVLAKWGLSRADLAPVTHKMALEMALWGMVGASGIAFAALSAWSGHPLEVGFCLAWLVVATIKVAGVGWYRWVLVRRRYIPFMEWVGFRKKFRNIIP